MYKKEMMKFEYEAAVRALSKVNRNEVLNILSETDNTITYLVSFDSLTKFFIGISINRYLEYNYAAAEVVGCEDIVLMIKSSPVIMSNSENCGADMMYTEQMECGIKRKKDYFSRCLKK